MKKLLLFLILGVLTISKAFAEMQLSEMTVEELLALDSEIHTVLVEKYGLAAPTIGTGSYIGGVDLKAGHYRLTVRNLINVDKLEISVLEGFYYVDDQMWLFEKIGDSCTVRLGEGQELSTTGGEVYIESVELPFAP